MRREVIRATGMTPTICHNTYRRFQGLFAKLPLELREELLAS
jgi:hypothetical protein